MRYRWPNGNQCAVVFTVDPDAESGLVFNKPREAATRLDEMEERRLGFLYHSNLMGDDIPYFVDTPHGQLVEVPTSWLLNDAPFYRHVYGATNQMEEPDRVIGQWIQEFRGMYRENGCYVMLIHPWMSGRASRVDGLERLIRAIREEPGVWWATALEVAQWQLETQQNLGVHVPIPTSAPA